MYHYNGKKIGTFSQAVEWVMEPSNSIARVMNLVYSYLDTMGESELKDLIYEAVTVPGHNLTLRSIVEDALLAMAEQWIEEGGRDQTPGDRVTWGLYEYENWEEME